MRTTITNVDARQILDSRGRPTIEVDVHLSGGGLGRASIPSGASVGSSESHELRDGDAGCYWGMGVLNAIGSVTGEIKKGLAGFDAANQRGLDQRLCGLDGTEQLKRLGANAILGVSIAACRAVANAQRQPLYMRIAELSGTQLPQLPIPMINILSGGLHARRRMDVQDFLAIPARAESLHNAIHTISLVRTAAERLAETRGIPTLLADEGGLSPGFRTGVEALKFMCQSIEAAGLEPGEDVLIGIDVAASYLQRGRNKYFLQGEDKPIVASQMVKMMLEWVRLYPVVSIEDGLGEDDWNGWQQLTVQAGHRIQIVGDDLFATHIQRLQKGITENVANSILLKLNQNGTLSGTLDVLKLAKANRYSTIVSARSGETEDSFIADLAVGTAAGQIKVGSLRTCGRLAKYNQLMRIELADRTPYVGAWPHSKL